MRLNHQRCAIAASGLIALMMMPGCAPWSEAVAPPTLAAGEATVAPPPGEPVLRAQSPWGPTYLAPGEVLMGPPVVYDQTYPQVVIDPSTVPHGPAVPNEPEAQWYDVLPPGGGAISPDFGLPEEEQIADRLPNPIYIPGANHSATWEALADEFTRYFPIESERQVQEFGGVLTEGSFESQWQTAATVFEPWKNDSVGAFNRWQSTLQTLRRRATVRVIPAAGGYEVGVRVTKQLEDLPRPERASSGAASLRNDASLALDRLNRVDRVLSSARWIDIGRDEPLEQEMLRSFQERLATR